MATASQLQARLKEHRTPLYWNVAQKSGFKGTYSEWFALAEPDIDAFCEADARAIFEFLTQDIKVAAGIGLSIGYPIAGTITTAPLTETTEAGSGATTEQGSLV